MNINRDFRSPNYSERQSAIGFVILHFTEINFEETLKRLCDPEAKVSAHYVIKSNGEIFNLVDDTLVTWHAGVSHWKNLEKLNDYSIGIEIDNDGKSDFPKIQMDSCVYLCNYLKDKYNIKQENFIGHSDIAPARKIDPGVLFNWSYLAKFGLGLWCNEAIEKYSAISEILLEFDSRGPKVLQLQTDLSKLGYKIDITGIFDAQTNFVVRAFQAHFYPKLLQKLGMDFYWSDDSKYFWDHTCDLILQRLIKQLAA